MTSDVSYLLKAIQEIEESKRWATKEEIFGFYGNYELDEDECRKMMESDIDEAKKRGFIQGVMILDLDLQAYDWVLTKAGKEFLCSGEVVKSVDDLPDMKWLLGRVKSLGKEATRLKIFEKCPKEIKQSVLTRAKELGLVVGNKRLIGSCWSVTEFGEEFLLEASNDVK